MPCDNVIGLPGVNLLSRRVTKRIGQTLQHPSEKHLLLKAFPAHLEDGDGGNQRRISSRRGLFAVFAPQVARYHVVLAEHEAQLARVRVQQKLLETSARQLGVLTSSEGVIEGEHTRLLESGPA